MTYSIPFYHWSISPTTSLSGHAYRENPAPTSSLRMLSGVRSRNKLSCGLCLGLTRSRDPSGKIISGIRDTPWADRSGAALAREHRLGLFSEPPEHFLPAFASSQIPAKPKVPGSWWVPNLLQGQRCPHTPGISGCGILPLELDLGVASCTGDLGFDKPGLVQGLPVPGPLE